MGTSLQAGAATSVITPDLGTPIPGLFHPRYARNVDDELGGAMDTLTFPRKTIAPQDLAVAEQVLSVPEGKYDRYTSGPFSWVVGQPIPKNLVHTYALECQRLAKLPERMAAPVQALRRGAGGCSPCHPQEANSQ